MWGDPDILAVLPPPVTVLPKRPMPGPVDPLPRDPNIPGSVPIIVTRPPDEGYAGLRGRGDEFGARRWRNRVTGRALRCASTEREDQGDRKEVLRPPQRSPTDL